MSVMSRKSCRAIGRFVLGAALLFNVCASVAAPAQGVAGVGAAPAGAFARAQARGALIVGVPFLAPEPAPGAKIRSPERLDEVMAQHLAQQLKLPVQLVQIDPAQRAAALATGEVDLLIADRVASDTRGSAKAPALDTQPLLAADIPGTTSVPTGYRARPKAVIRSDTTLRHWRDVKGLTVCMSAAAFQAQALARQWGAQVQSYRVPSDALVAVREGGCDVGVIDDLAWEPLMKFPEWKKFAATLPAAAARSERVWVLADDPVARAWLESAMQQWRRDNVVAAMVEQWARDVAFDVYLDQEVPDCHGG
jgi:polar amino acid transport system substrate-binding protein